jgi:hypothetical protein
MVNNFFYEMLLIIKAIKKFMVDQTRYSIAFCVRDLLPWAEATKHSEPVEVVKSFMGMFNGERHTKSPELINM